MNQLEVIEDWFDQYGDDVYSYLIYYTHRHDVEDLVQEVFIKALRGLPTFKEESSPKTWLISIARNVANDAFRKKQPVPYEEIGDFLSVSEETPESVYEQEEEKEQLYSAIKSLKEDYQEVIILRALKELSIAETAEILKWTQVKVRVTYHRALAALKKQLSKKEGRLA